MLRKKLAGDQHWGELLAKKMPASEEFGDQQVDYDDVNEDDHDDVHDDVDEDHHDDHDVHDDAGRFGAKQANSIGGNKKLEHLLHNDLNRKQWW